jgi:hypothetical protein
MNAPLRQTLDGTSYRAAGSECGVDYVFRYAALLVGEAAIPAAGMRVLCGGIFGGIS